MNTKSLLAKIESRLTGIAIKAAKIPPRPKVDLTKPRWKAKIKPAALRDHFLSALDKLGINVSGSSAAKWKGKLVIDGKPAQSGLFEGEPSLNGPTIRAAVLKYTKRYQFTKIVSFGSTSIYQDHVGNCMWLTKTGVRFAKKSEEVSG